MIVRELNENDAKQVEEMDELSGNYVSQWLDSENYGFGLFLDNNLIGYCTIGGADDVCEQIDAHMKNNDRIDKYDIGGLLSDVFIKEEFRRKGYGETMIGKAIELSSYDVIYCEPSTNKLPHFYEKNGFEIFDYYGGESFGTAFPLMVKQ